MTPVYPFNGECSSKSELGNKGANLVAMSRLNLPVPPGFIVPIEAYKQWRETGVLPESDIRKALIFLELQSGKKLGHGLEVSVRSSAPVSMPGMMDTVLNIGNAGIMMSSTKQIFSSWNNPRANEYRRLNRIAADLGTAAVIQAMVYGNKDGQSGTGVVFSRNPSTGEKGLGGREGRGISVPPPGIRFRGENPATLVGDLVPDPIVIDARADLLPHQAGAFRRGSARLSPDREGRSHAASGAEARRIQT